METRTTRRLTSIKIYSERPDIEKAVYDKFPISKAEKKCYTEKSIMDALRMEMAKKLYENPET